MSVDRLRSTPPPAKLVIFGNGDVVVSGPMAEALRYLADTQALPADSVKIVAGNPRDGQSPETVGQFLARVQSGRVPLTPKQLEAYKRMTGFDKVSPDTPLPHTDVTRRDGGFASVMTQILGSGNDAFKGRIVDYAGLPPVCYPGLLENLHAYPHDGEIVTLLEKPFGTSSGAARGLLQQIQTGDSPRDVKLMDHFKAYPGTLALNQLLQQPAFAGALNNKFVDGGRIRMDEQIVSSDRGYFRALGEEKDGHDHGGVAEDMVESHGWVGLLPIVAGDVLQHVEIDSSSIHRSQVDGFNDPQLLQNLHLQPSDAATRVSVGFQVNTPDLQGVPWSMESTKGVAIPPDSPGATAPASWFGAELHFKALPPELVQYLNAVSQTQGGPPVTVNTAGTLSMRVSKDPRVTFTPEGAEKPITLMTAADTDNIPPEASLILSAMNGQDTGFATPAQAMEAWRLTDVITAHFSQGTGGYVPLGHYAEHADVRTLPL